MAIPNKETNLNLGDKTVEDLCENLGLDGDNITGALKHIDNWEEFSTTNNTGNFLPLYFEEAKGKPDGTINCLLKGTGVNAKKPKSVDPKDGLFVFKISNNDNTIEITQEGKTTRTLTLTKVTLN